MDKKHTSSLLFFFFLLLLTAVVLKGSSKCVVVATSGSRKFRSFHVTNDGMARAVNLRGGSINKAAASPKIHYPSSGTELRTTTVTEEPTTYRPPTFSKTEEEASFIESVLRTNFIFNEYSTSATDHNNAGSLNEAVAAFERVDFEKGSLLCKQGDTIDIDYLYIVYRGECSVIVDGKRLVESYGTLSEGILVGDIAMIYDKKARSATVQATTHVTAFRLHRDAFDYFLAQTAQTTTTQSLTYKERVIMMKEQLRKDLTNIDAVIDQVAGIKARYSGGDIIQRFEPSRMWLWSRWEGTILQQVYKPAVWNMMLSAAFIGTFRFICNNVNNQPITWRIGMLPDPNHPILSRMHGLTKLWKTLVPLVTFVLTFFLSVACRFWHGIYDRGRDFQGSLNDISLIVATRAERDPETSHYTPRAKKLLEEIASDIRLFNIIAWSYFSAKFSILQTPKGLSRMLSRGIMTRAQYKILVPQNSKNNKGSSPEPQYTTLQWIYLRLLKGRNDGILALTAPVETAFTTKILELRKNMSNIRDNLDGKMPLAYVHLVQSLVDFFLALSPFALYPELGMWSVPAVGVLHFFYSGLLDLSKICLFPLENVAFYKNISVNMDVGVLITESNAGSNRWKSGIETLPF